MKRFYYLVALLFLSTTIVAEIKMDALRQHPEKKQSETYTSGTSATDSHTQQNNYHIQSE